MKVNRSKKPKTLYNKNINNQIIKSPFIAKLNFDRHISKIRKKAGNRINVTTPDEKERKTLNKFLLLQILSIGQTTTRTCH